MYTKDGRNFHVYIPENINLDWLNAPLRQPALYLLNLITSKWYKRDQGGFVRLNSIFLRNVVSREVKSLRDQLEEHKVIQVDHQYVKNSFSKGFRFHPQHAASRLTRHTLTDLALLGRIRKHHTRITPNPDCPIECGLYAWLQQLKINVAGAKGRIIMALDKSGEWASNRLMSVEAIDRQDWTFVRDRFGRVHTNFSSLWSELRGLCSLASTDDKLVNLDIVNSQPLFLLVALLKQLNSLKPNQSSIHLLHYVAQQERVNLPEDLKDYARQVQAGTFYDEIMKKTSAKNRKNFKRRFFRDVLFSLKDYDCEERQIFKDTYPTAYDLLQELKAKEPRRAAWELQRAESQFIIDTCCRRLLTAYPHVPVLTIHDSITTTYSHKDIVRGIMLEEFMKLGVRPSIAI